MALKGTQRGKRSLLSRTGQAGLACVRLCDNPCDVSTCCGLERLKVASL